jgi:hypothetical protein
MLRLLLVLSGCVVAALAATVCFGAVLIELARREGLRRAALGLFCPPWAFAWGWRQRRGAWMIAWTGAAAYLVGSMVFLQLAMG